MADLGSPLTSGERGWSALRLCLLLTVLIGGAWIYWRLPLGLMAISALLMAAIAYSLLLIASHEMLHGSCLGLGIWEQSLACILSWPMAWPYLTYGRLHRLHHRWNGIDPRDPERTTPLPEEVECAGLLRRLWQRHQLPLRLLLLGGLGLIVDTAIKGWRLRSLDRALRRARWLDFAGVSVAHAFLLLTAVTHGVLLRYLLFWLLLERVIGLIVQFRGLVEHHGLWLPASYIPRSNYLLIQLTSTRNVTSTAWFNALMGGLPNHSAHHAFPWIPSTRLPLATCRIDAVLQRHGVAPLIHVESYGVNLCWLWRSTHHSLGPPLQAR